MLSQPQNLPYFWRLVRRPCSGHHHGPEFYGGIFPFFLFYLKAHTLYRQDRGSFVVILGGTFDAY